MEEASPTDGGLNEPMEVEEDEPIFVKPDDIRKGLLGENPIDFVKRFEETHRLKIEGSGPVLDLCDLLGFGRGEVYRSMKTIFIRSLLDRLQKLSEEQSIKLLAASLDYLEHPDLKEVPRGILTNYNKEFPMSMYERLSELPSTLLLGLPEKVRTKTWELHLDVFDKHVDSLIKQYLNDRIVAKVSDNMALAPNLSARREKTMALTSAKLAIGSSSVLYERFTAQVRQRYAETGDSQLCTLQTDILMSIVVEKRISRSDVAEIVDNLKLKHSNDRTFGIKQEGSKETDMVNRLKLIVETLVAEVIRARDGDPEPAPAPLALPPAKKQKQMTLEQAVKSMLKKITAVKKAKPFVKSAVELHPQIRDAYLAIIDQPMHFEKIFQKAPMYGSVEEVEDDIDLIYRNCLKYNQEKHALVPDAAEVVAKAKALLQKEVSDNHVVDPIDVDREVVSLPPLPPGPPPPIILKLDRSAAKAAAQAANVAKNAVSLKAADAAMVLADMNTQHSLAKMMWDVLAVEVCGAKVMPRDVPAVSHLLWLLRLGEEAHAIVRSYIDRQPHAVLTEGPRSKNKLDLLLHRVIPLWAWMFNTRNPETGQFLIAPKTLEYCNDSFLARELLLRFVLLLIRAGDERSVILLLQSCKDMASHPGFRRGLSYVLKDASGLMQLRKFACEEIFLPYVESVSKPEADKDGKEFADAHEYLATLIGSKVTLKQFTEGEPHTLLQYVQQALKGVSPTLYLSTTFKGARQGYEQFLAHEAFNSQRESLGLPVVGSGKEMSPGSAKPSPSPGTFRPQSASPYASAGRSGTQSVSPSFYTSPQ